MDFLLSYRLFESIRTARKSYDLSEDQINFLKNLNAKPNLIDLFAKYLIDGESQEQIKSTYELYNQYKQLFKDEDIRLEKFPSLESLYDFIYEKINEQKINKTIKQLPSGTRKYVTDDLRNLLKNNLNVIEEIKKFYSRKGGSSKNKSKEGLYNSTKNKINSLLGDWKPERIKKKMKGLNTDIIHEDDETLILEIHDFEASSKLGSTEYWCLSQNNSDWDKYYQDGINRIYFIYDFTESIDSPYSMIEISINPSGNPTQVWNKIDKNIKNEKEKYQEFLPYLKPIPKEELKKKININNIVQVSEYGLVDELKKLLKQGVDPSKRNNSAIVFASEKGQTEIVDMLLQDDRIDPSDQNNYAIVFASHNGHKEIVKLLLQDNRVDPGDEDNSTIRKASMEGYTDIVKLLLQDNRVDPSDDDNQAIKIASIEGHTEIVELLLQDNRVREKLPQEEIEEYKNKFNI